MQPWWLDWTAGLFPVILVVFLLRSFLFEPFKIPSGSMIPTLLVGDLILVNKFTYGVRLPVINTKIIDGTRPQRGDVMVFRYPPEPQPGLHQARGRRAGRRGGLPEQEAHHQRPAGADEGAAATSSTRTAMRYAKQFEEKLGGASTASCSTTTTARPSFAGAAGTSRSARIAATVSRAWSARCRRATTS